MKPPLICPECGAIRHDDTTCQDDFHQMLYWESENPDNWAVHHLTVACYHIQHPSLYSPEALDYAKGLLEAFLAEGRTPDDVRKRNRAQVDSSQRTWKIKGTPDRHGAHPHPVTWTMTAADVVAGGADDYCANVERWARSIHEIISKSNYGRGGTALYGAKENE